MKPQPSIHLTHSVENNLILACAATRNSDLRRARVRRLAGECQDWDHVVETCRRLGVSSLASFALETNACDLVPANILASLKARFQANARRNLLLSQELLSLIQEFQSDGIKVMPFKGPLLAITAYGNLALREFLDLDILVPKGDFRRARGLLARRGYQPPGGQAGASDESFFKSQLGCDYLRSDGRLALELHWSFVQTWLGFRADFDEIWRSSGVAKIGPVSVLTVPPDIMLMYLCAHGTKHRWSRLSWVVDVAEFLQSRSEWDWPALLARAKNSGCQRTFFIGLHLAKTLLQAPVPDDVWSRISRDNVAVLLARELGEKMFVRPDDSGAATASRNRDWFHILTKERWREKFVYLRFLAAWACLPSEKDRQWVRLPRWLHWLYPVLRPVRAAWQSLPAVVAAV